VSKAGQRYLPLPPVFKRK